MGIHANVVPVFLEIANRLRFGGTICTLGVQDLPPGLTATWFYSSLGFSNFETLDVSDYEGAQLKFDLNADELPPDLVARFDCVLNGGTLEHVFHVPNALASMTRMLRPGGFVIHLLPCDGWADHGFYQFSPTLMFDYYAAAGFEALESILFSYQIDKADEWLVRPLAPGDLGSGNAGALDEGVHLYLFLACRGHAPVERPRPTQRHYATPMLHGPGSRPRRFLPYSLVSGLRRELPLRARFDLPPAAPEIGHCWTAQLPDISDVSDCSEHPARSRLILLENDEPLGPAHSSHLTIRETGHGAYSHWGGTLYFSTSDNQDPTANGRRYTVVVPR